MARIPSGILGALQGSVGPVTGYMRLGKPILRSKSSSRQVKQTPARKQQQEKLKAALPFVKAFTGTGFFKQSFPDYGQGRTGYNLALSHALNFAVVKSGTQVQLSWPLVMVSRGNLPKAEGAVASLGSNGRIIFNWADNSGTGRAMSNDRVILAAYSPQMELVICSLDAGTRADKQSELLMAQMENGAVATWIGFVNHEGTDASDSVYTGTIQLD